MGKGRCVESFSQLVRWSNNNCFVSFVFIWNFACRLPILRALCLTIIVFFRKCILISLLSFVFLCLLIFSPKYFRLAWLFVFYFLNSIVFVGLHCVYVYFEKIKILRNRTSKHKRVLIDFRKCYCWVFTRILKLLCELFLVVYLFC